MELIFFLGILILGVLLYDTRSRLTSLERQVRGEEWRRPAPARAAESSADLPVRRSAVIVDRPSAPPVAPPSAQPVEDVVEPVAPMPVVDEPAPLPAEPVTEPIPAPVMTAGADEASPAPAPIARGPAFSFEDLFGRKLPIWAGGITLVVAAVLLVKYSIDAGLLSPPVRVMLGLLFGAGLIGGAEVARRKEDLVQDRRVAQALAGAGIGSLYAATLAAHNLYDLIGPGLAFAGLSASTALAMGLALRFGAPSAVLGLVGGLATPAMIQSGAPNVPLLAGYLAMVIGGITLLSRRQRWFWLGIIALVGGAGWSMLLIVMGGLSQLSTLAVGLLVLLFGLGLPAVAATDHRGPAVRGVAALVAALQLALLVANGGYDALNWGLYGLLSIAFVWLTTRVAALRPALAVPLLTALALAALWPAPPSGLFAAVMAGIVAIFGGVALWRLWQEEGGLLEAGQVALVALAGFAVCYGHYAEAEIGSDRSFALLALAFAVLPAAGAAVGWNHAARAADKRFALLALTAGLLVIVAAVLGLANWTNPIAIALVAGGLLLLGRVAQDKWLPGGALAYLGIGIVALLLGGEPAELLRLAGDATLAEPLQAGLRWAVPFAVTIAFAWHYGRRPGGKALQVGATLLGYGLVAQFVPAAWLAIAAAIALLAAVEAMRRAPQADIVPVPLVLAGIALLWAVGPLFDWLLAAGLSLLGEPVLVGDLPKALVTAQRLLVPALVGLAAFLRMQDRLPAVARQIVFVETGALALIGGHIFYKQFFAIRDLGGFTALGVAERTLWEIALIGIGVALRSLAGRPRAALALIAVGLAHNLYYSLILHNPLWAEQAVGPWPLANLLLPAFAIAFAGPMLIERIEPALGGSLRRPGRILQMIVILLFAYASLRQLFSGSLLVGTAIGSVENIGWSVLAIALALGFLGWGIRSGQRDWRIGSLLLMLAAVAKVFLLDASGLEGLLRIISFLALGFSLIGIGWLYSRYLKADPA